MCTNYNVDSNTQYSNYIELGGVEIHSIECIEYCTKDQSNVKDVEDVEERRLRY